MFENVSLYTKPLQWACKVKEFIKPQQKMIYPPGQQDNGKSAMNTTENARISLITLFRSRYLNMIKEIVAKFNLTPEDEERLQVLIPRMQRLIEENA